MILSADIGPSFPPIFRKPLFTLTWCDVISCDNTRGRGLFIEVSYAALCMKISDPVAYSFAVHIERSNAEMYSGCAVNT